MVYPGHIYLAKGVVLEYHEELSFGVVHLHNLAEEILKGVGHLILDLEYVGIAHFLPHEILKIVKDSFFVADDLFYTLPVL